MVLIEHHFTMFENLWTTIFEYLVYCKRYVLIYNLNRGVLINRCRKAKVVKKSRLKYVDK